MWVMGLRCGVGVRYLRSLPTFTSMTATMMLWNKVSSIYSYLNIVRLGVDEEPVKEWMPTVPLRLWRNNVHYFQLPKGEGSVECLGLTSIMSEVLRLTHYDRV